jgi:hypothetical protein
MATQDTGQDDVLIRHYRDLAAHLRRWADVLMEDDDARVIASLLAHLALVVEREAERLDLVPPPPADRLGVLQSEVPKERAEAEATDG